MQHGTVTLEEILAFSYRIKQTLTIDLPLILLGIYPK